MGDTTEKWFYEAALCLNFGKKKLEMKRRILWKSV